MTMHVDILSLFPEYFRSPLQESMLARAIGNGIMNINLVNIRDFAEGQHNQADDRPFGGGPGMVMLPGPIQKALESVHSAQAHCVHLSPQGTPLTASKARELGQKKHLIFLCGHYEGIDQRIVDVVDEEISIGDYVLSNGCLPALVVLDAVMRFLPGALGHELAASQDSFENFLFDCPHYTQPRNFQGKEVPEVLLSGDHQKIAQWRYQEAVDKTLKKRPDLFLKHLMQIDSLPADIKERHTSVRLQRITLMVSDLKLARRFYRDLLGLSCSSLGEGGYIFALGDSQELVVCKGKKEGSVAPFALTLTSDNLEGVATRFEQEEHHFVRNESVEKPSLGIVDPDGYSWIVSCERKKSALYQ